MLLPAVLPRPSRPDARRAVLWALGAAAGGVLVYLAATHAGPFVGALDRLFRVNPAWALLGLGFEAASIAGYVLLLWHVAGRRAPRFGLRASYQVTLAGSAATRLLPTGGAGGVAVTVWALRRAGHHGRDSARTLLTFLVLLYSVFLGSILVAGLALSTGEAAGRGPSALSAGPALFAALGIAGALAVALRRPRARAEASGRMARLRGGASVLGDAVRDALRLVRDGDVRLLGALAWWGFDVAVLWAAFHALGSPPPTAVLVLGYFVGQLCNLLPLPGTVSGGMVGVLLAFGVAPDLALAAVLAYRAIAVWTPAPTGALAVAGLRRTVERWAREDESGRPVPEPCETPSRPFALGGLGSVPAVGGHRPLVTSL